MPMGQGYGPYAGRPQPGQDDPLVELGLSAAYGFDMAPPVPPMAPGTVAPAPQAPGAPVGPMAPPPPVMAGAMGPSQGLAGDPQAQALLAGKSPEELAQIVMQVREFNQKRKMGQQ